MSKEISDCISKVNRLANEVMEESKVRPVTALMYLKNTKKITNREYKTYLDYLAK